MRPKKKAKHGIENARISTIQTLTQGPFGLSLLLLKLKIL